MMPFDFITRVAIICAKHRGSVSSWGRTLKHNKAVGGLDNSLHMLWLGCDIVLDEMKKNTEFEKDAGTMGMIAYFGKDHYHLEPK